YADYTMPGSIGIRPGRSGSGGRLWKARTWDQSARRSASKLDRYALRTHWHIAWNCILERARNEASEARSCTFDRGSQDRQAHLDARLPVRRTRDRGRAIHGGDLALTRCRALGEGDHRVRW